MAVDEDKSLSDSEFMCGDPFEEVIGGMGNAEGYDTDEHGLKKHLGSDDSFDFQDQNENYGKDPEQIKEEEKKRSISTPSSESGEEDQSPFMPLVFAQNHIKRIEEDMRVLHERHVKLIREME